MKKRLSYVLILVLSILLIACDKGDKDSSGPSSNITINGKVVDEYQNPISGAEISVDDITAAETAFTAENFSVQYNIVNDNPVASSMSIPALVGDGEDLVINFKAAEYDGTWADLDGQVTTHLHITIIGVDEES